MPPRTLLTDFSAALPRAGSEEACSSFVKSHQQSSSSPVVGRDTFSWTRLLKAPFNLAWNTSRDGPSTASLGSLFQCLTTPTVKNFFVIANLNPLSFTMKLLPFVLSAHGLANSLPSSFLQVPFSYWKATIRSPQSLLFSYFLAVSCPVELTGFGGCCLTGWLT